MKHIVVLGAGFGGLELSSRLSDSLAGEVRATLITTITRLLGDQ